MKKIYVLDTNVLMQDPTAFYKFEDNEVVLPDTVIEELDTLKSRSGELGYNSRTCIREIEMLRKTGDILSGITLSNGGSFRIETDCKEVEMPEDWDISKADNNIIRIAKGLGEKEKLADSNTEVILVSKDSIVRIKATMVGVKSQDYENEIVKDEELDYIGRCSIEVPYDLLMEFYKNENLKIDKEIINENHLIENEYLTLTCGTSSALGRYTNGTIVGLRHKGDKPSGITLMNSGQRFAAEALLMSAEEAPLVILKGPAGTAKTFLTLACSLEQIMQRKPEYRKLLLTRANVSFDNDLGALPGDEIDKVGPLLRGCMDNLELILDKKAVEVGGEKAEASLKEQVAEIFSKGLVSIEALGYLRGRSITNQIVLIDEAQNTTPNQMLGILTRAGEGTKIVICGDLDQIDNTKLDRHTNGLAFALKTMSGSPLCHVVGFMDNETTRSALAKEAAKRMTQD